MGLFRFLLRRLMWLIPAWLGLCLLAFVLGQSTPGDPVLLSLNVQDPNALQASGGLDPQVYANQRARLGLNQPVFYFHLTSWAQPDTLYRVADPQQRRALERWAHAFGNWPAVQKFGQQLQQAEQAAASLGEQQAIQQIWNEPRPQAVSALLEASASASGGLQPLLQAWRNLQEQQQPWRSWAPRIQWNGVSCQFHFWLKNALQGDWGQSYQDGRSVAAKLGEALQVTLLLNGLGLLLAYMLALGLGVLGARYSRQWPDRLLTMVLAGLYALPVFWVGSLLILYVANTAGLGLLPTHGLQSTSHSEAWPLGERLADWAAHLLLPVVCLVYPPLALLSRQLRNALLETFRQPYLLTAQAKGLGWPGRLRHGLLNAWLPYITLLSGLLPQMVGGAVIVEQLFSLPGAGLLTLDAVYARDYPLLTASLALTGGLTLLGVLLADLLYALADPRIRLNTQA